jgi:probable F420-dependent oxidoreductase
MKYGVHLPQAGPAGSVSAVQAVARHAEDLGFSDIWVSDHLAIPKGAPYPPTSYILEPLVVLTWAAAVTAKVGLGTTVLVLPLRPPVLLAKMLGTLDLMSGGRVIVGAGAGWLEEEFDALGASFKKRGKATNEAIEIMRSCWTEDPVNIEGPTTGTVLVNIRVKPQPTRKIPIWIGGNAEPSLRRAIRAGDGWHGAFRTPNEAAPITERLRRDRPESSFTLSMRARWDALRDGRDSILRDLEMFRKAGIQHILTEPAQRDQDSWMRCTEEFAKILDIT